MKFKGFRKILIYLVVILTTLTMGMVIIRRTHVLDDIDTKLFSFFSSVKYTLIDRPFQTLFGWVDDYTEFYKLREENDLLRRDIDSLNL